MHVHSSPAPPRTWPHSDGDFGTIRYQDNVGEVKVVPFYWSSEPLMFGDQVEFRVGLRTYDQLCYALEMKVVQKARDIRFKVACYLPSRIHVL